MSTTDRSGDRPSPARRARAERAVAAHGPGRSRGRLRDLGGGLDHSAFLDGDRVLRVADSTVEVTREAALLQLVAGHVSLPVPVPVVVDQVDGVLGYRLLPGRSLLGRVPPTGAADRLGAFLRELHGIDPGAVADRAPVEPAAPEDWLADLVGPGPLLKWVRDSQPRPAGTLVLAHADLGAEHILEDDGRLTGIIDWTDAAVTDPALDFARLYRDFGPAFLDDVLRAYGRDDRHLRDRITFFARCAALEDLAYGRQSGLADYGRAAELSLSWLFPGVARLLS